MSDQETNQLLRELLSVQREQLECLRQSARISEKNTELYQASQALYRGDLESQRQRTEESNKLYQASDVLYREQLATKPWERGVRILTLLGVVVLLGYIILR